MIDVLKVDPDNLNEESILKAVAILKKGGIIAYPTETFYGLGVDADNDSAVEKIFSVKGRNFKNPVALIISDKELLRRLTSDIPVYCLPLIDHFWPGPLTLVFRASPHVSARLTAGTGKIGIRISSHPVALALSKLLGKPITATSANLSGHPECTTAKQVKNQLGKGIDLIVDAGTTKGGVGSTILDIAGGSTVVLRAGVYPEAEIRRILQIS